MQIFLSFILILSDAIDKSREIWSAAIELAHLMQTAAGFQGKLGEKGRGGGRGGFGNPARHVRNVAGTLPEDGYYANEFREPRQFAALLPSGSTRRLTQGQARVRQPDDFARLLNLSHQLYANHGRILCKFDTDVTG